MLQVYPIIFDADRYYTSQAFELLINPFYNIEFELCLRNMISGDIDKQFSCCG